MSYLPQEVIRKKRDGHKLSTSEIQFLVQGITDGTLMDAQLSSFAMAVYFQGLDIEERAALTVAMRDSGTVYDWAPFDFAGPVLDKHSTGGVGDKVSLILAPVIAACGGYVPMISGRGLGHTGGTTDKFESIPGYTTMPSAQRLGEVVKEVGCAVITQTQSLAPADKKFYSIRDVTATVESIGLITASILSKKLAAGLDGLVLDVKTGSGAFKEKHEEAKELAQSLVSVANTAGLPTRALLTDMNSVLGVTAGNTLEVWESLDFLTGKKQDPRLKEVTVDLCAHMLELGQLVSSVEEGRQKVETALSSGAALERFGKMVGALGGPKDFIEKPESYLQAAPVVKEISAPKAGVIAKMDTRDIGTAVVALGGGRSHAGQDIDHRVGFSDICGLGTSVEKGDPVAVVHAADEAGAEQAVQNYLQSLTLTEEKPSVSPIVYEVISHA